ncbi:MAG: ABC-F family ATP-binding cassette domain-containing protein, partial [Candidatus Babeliales bacterium]
ELSVGWKMRIVLAKLLLQKADFYLFDEPTNHLDIVAKDWFLDFLKYASFGFVLISHDRYFLDHLCQYIFDIDRGNLKIYRGNYTKYLEQKANDDAILESQYEAQQRHIKKTMETINRFKAKASKASMAQSMLKNLEKIDLIKIESNAPNIRLNFSNVKRSGDVVLKVSDVNKTFEAVELFKNVSFDIMRGDKVALIAANGKGKTTLLNLIAGKYPLENGTLKFGHNVEIAFFEQDQELTLNKNRTILEEVESICTTSEMRSRVRALLGAFLFSGDDVEKKIAVLSGGEKNRVAMVKTLLLDANFLILDEPTNHLDLQTKDILLKALNQYPGTILFVSHDRTFVDGLASRVLELNPNGIINYPGNYESFLYHKKHNELEHSTSNSPDKSTSKAAPMIPQTQATPGKTVSSKEWYETKKQMGSIERKIETLEKQLVKLNQDFEFLEFGTPEFEKTSKHINEIKSQIEKFYEKWEELQKIINP